MTREDYEAHKEDYKDNNVSSSAFVLIQDVYIRILEEQLKAKNERIREIEEAIKPKSCGLCVFFTFDEELNDGFGQCFYSIHFPNIYSSYHEGDCHYCSEFKPKDNA